MILRKPGLQVGESEARLVATLESETGTFAPFELFFAVPRSLVGWLDVSGTPFLPSLLLLAGNLQERLRLEAGVSPMLLHQATCVNGLYSSWWGMGPVQIEAEAMPAYRCPCGEGVGLFFRRGVNSWYSVLRARNHAIPEPITHLIYVPDFDSPVASQRKEAVKLNREAAASVGLPLLVVSTNLCELLDRHLYWEQVLGSALASVGLALGGWLRALIVPSSHLADGAQSPWDATPQLVALWSTEQTRIRADGEDVTRAQKLQHIAAWPEALSHLKRKGSPAEAQGRCGANQQCYLVAEPLPAEEDKPVQPVPEVAPAVPAIVEMSPEFVPSAAPEEIWKHLSRPIVRQEGEWPPDGPRRVEITWTRPAAGRLALPLRPPTELQKRMIEACRGAESRPVPWCIIDWASPASASVAVRLTEAWGAGIVALGSAAQPEGDHGLLRHEAAAVERCCRIRVWRGSAEQLDPFRVLAALTHGCLPLQLVDEADHEELTACLPAGLAAFTLPWPVEGPLPRLSPDEIIRRLESGLSVILRGSLQRDLAVLGREGVRCVPRAA